MHRRVGPFDNERRLNRRAKAATGIIAFCVVVALVWVFWPKTRHWVEVGRTYKLFSYSAVNTPTPEGDEVQCYLFTIEEPGTLSADEAQDRSLVADALPRDTILVPKGACVEDRTLPPNTIVWERHKIEGFMYLVVRFRASYKVRATEQPLVSQQKKGFQLPDN